MKVTLARYLSKLILVLRSHGLACLLAIIVGAASAAPIFLAQKALGEAYQGFPLLFNNNEDYYLARVRDIMAGNWLASSPYLYEYKNSLPVIFPFGEYLYALPALLFGVSALSVLMATKFVFPALLFLLVYLLLYNLSKRTSGDKITASLGGLLITLGAHFVNYKDAWLLLTGQNTNLFLSMWTRPVNPITGALYLLVFLILIWQSFNSEKKRYPVLSGLVLGLMTGYIFSWLVALAIVSAVIIISWFRRRFALIKKIFFIIFYSLLAGLPSWYLWLQPFFMSEKGRDAVSRSGLILTHYPIINKEVLAQTIFFLALFLFERRRKKKNREEFEEWWWFAAALVIGNWLVYNQQIITGRVVWPAHLTQYTTLTCYLTYILALGNYFKTRTPRLWGTVVALAGCVIALFTMMTTLTYNSQAKELSELQPLIPFFNWLDQSAAKDCVVLAEEPGDNDSLSRWIPAFTHCNTYSTGYYPPAAPVERIYFNYLVSLRLQGIKEQDLEKYLWDHKVDLRRYFSTDWSQVFIPANTEADDSWLAGPIKTLVDRYDSFLKEDFTAALRRYRVDYLASQEPLAAPLKEQFSGALFLGKFGSVYVYHL